MRTPLFVLATALTLHLCAASAAAADPAVVRHLVQPGESRESLTRRYGVDAGADVVPGAIVAIPRPTTGWPLHHAVRGQTLWAISRSFQVPLDEIRQVNGIAGDRIEVGQPIALPGADPQAVKSREEALRESPPQLATPAPPPPEPAPAAPTANAAWVAVRLPDGRQGWAPAQAVLAPATQPQPPARIVEVARRMLGTPYVWGGQTPNGADCSGFVQEVFRLGGHALPRLADEQFAVTVEVAAADVRPGDLVFFTTYLPGPSHVGIYEGEGRFIHASSSQGVTESALGETYYKERFLGARRPAAWRIDEKAVSGPSPGPSPETPARR